MIEESLYKKIVEYVPICTIDIVIFDKTLKKTLLFKRDNEPAKNKYYTIGGRLNKDEKIFNCAIRKVEEEIRIKIKKKDLVEIGYIYESFNNCYYSEKISSNFINIYFSFILENVKNVELDLQHSKYKWYDIKNLDKGINKFVKEKIIKSLKIMEK